MKLTCNFGYIFKKKDWYYNHPEEPVQSFRQCGQTSSEADSSLEPQHCTAAVSDCGGPSHRITTLNSS